MKSQSKNTKKTRNLAKTRAEILSVTFREVFQNGFQGVSIDDIVKKTNLTKGALYHQFPTKLDLGYALVEEVVRPMIIERWIRPLDDFENPLEGILQQMQKLIGDLEPQYLKLGCPLNNLVQEMAPIDKGFKKRLQISVNLWIDEMNRHLIRAQKKGFLRPEVRTYEAATFIVMAHEGFYGLLKGLDEPQKAFEALFHSLKAYFKSIESEKSKASKSSSKSL